MTARNNTTAPEHRWQTATGKFTLTPAEALQRSRRAAAKARQESRLRIGEEYLTMAEIGERLGMTKDMARGRYDKIKGKPGAITLERLRLA